MLLQVFDTKTKDAGYARTALRCHPPHRSSLVKQAFDYGTPVKAQNDSVFIFQKSSYARFP